jgi:hypothetical protein
MKNYTFVSEFIREADELEKEQVEKLRAELREQPWSKILKKCQEGKVSEEFLEYL